VKKKSFTLQVRERERESHSIAPTINQGKRTHDGIEEGALRYQTWLLKLMKAVPSIDKVRERERLVSYITNNLTTISKISIIGHSLGGLYARCLVGKLYGDGILPLILKPMTLIALAT
jgi:hypothetical protein